ncbi:MAG: hypothetical protein ACOVLB_06325 [Candidatus Nanopelagicus sp.]
MKNLLLILALSLFGSQAFAQQPTLSVCQGKFALCAASTCTKTGKTITTNNGVTYPEVLCTCPVLEGPSIAQLNAGVMKGTCSVDDPTTQVWSLFAPRLVESFHYPQEANNFVRTPSSETRAKVQSCPGSLAAGSANCWGMMCAYNKNPTNGTVTAVCSCPIGQIAKGTSFLTEAGQGDKAACAKHPVAAPNPLATPASTTN